MRLVLSLGRASLVVPHARGPQLWRREPVVRRGRACSRQGGRARSAAASGSQARSATAVAAQQLAGEAERLEAAVLAVPGLGATRRGLDACSGSGELIPHLQVGGSCSGQQGALMSSARSAHVCDPTPPSSPKGCDGSDKPCSVPALGMAFVRRCGLQARGVREVLAVASTPEAAAALEARFGPPSTLGNDPCVRAWCGDVAGLPPYQVSRRCAALHGS